MDINTTVQAAAVCAVAKADLSPISLYNMLMQNPGALCMLLPPPAQCALATVSRLLLTGVLLHADGFAVLVDLLRAPDANHVAIIEKHRAAINRVVARIMAGDG